MARTWEHTEFGAGHHPRAEEPRGIGRQNLDY